VRDVDVHARRTATLVLTACSRPNAPANGLRARISVRPETLGSTQGRNQSHGFARTRIRNRRDACIAALDVLQLRLYNMSNAAKRFITSVRAAILRRETALVAIASGVSFEEEDLLAVSVDPDHFERLAMRAVSVDTIIDALCEATARDCELLPPEPRRPQEKWRVAVQLPDGRPHFVIVIVCGDAEIFVATAHHQVRGMT
jgi:hypothetical protein